MNDKIQGYKELDQRTVEAVNAVKRFENDLGDLVEGVRLNPQLEINEDDLDVAINLFVQGFMMMTRAITRPESRLK